MGSKPHLPGSNIEDSNHITQKDISQDRRPIEGRLNARDAQTSAWIQTSVSG